ncbi:MAG: transcriptional regulator [Prevotella sp.]|nr:transcriptional regulator [Prevotella sp.]
MRHILLIVLLMFCLPNCQAGHNDLTDIYRTIDEAIAHSADYVADYEQKTAELRTTLQRTADKEQQLYLTQQLFERYRAYNNDSALHYINQAIKLASQTGRAAVAARCQALMAFQCSTVGMYTEALTILDKTNRRQLDTLGLTDYYNARMHVYGELCYYTRLDSLHRHYRKLADSYRDSVLMVASPQSETYLLQKEAQLMDQRRLKEALKVNDQRLAAADSGSHQYAIVAYYRHIICNQMGDERLTRYWLGQSALCDIRGAVMDQASLIILAQLLNDDGDLARSYNYIRFTWDCNNRFNTRMRSWQIAPILNVIESGYQQKMHNGAVRMRWALAAISVLALLVLASLISTWREKKQLSRAQAQMKRLNEELSTVNAQLSTANTQLSAANAQLSTLNSQLTESNHVKEEYIGRFMSLCAQYITKLDNYRKMVLRRMKQKELDELFRIVKSTELKDHELEELYENFDSVFLHLFPNFVADFNALLTPEAQIQPKEEHRLTTDLRIFALIRLGIEDSSKIAEFLHYSVNTIYNYRARIKNGAADSRDDFERRVKQLGLPR